MGNGASMQQPIDKKTSLQPSSDNKNLTKNRPIDLQLLNFDKKIDLDNTSHLDDKKLSEMLTQLGRLKPENDFESQTIPILFQWPYGGKSVFVTGSFNNWNEKVELKQISHDYFKKGKYMYAKSVTNVIHKNLKSHGKSYDKNCQTNVNIKVAVPNTYYCIVDLPVGNYSYKFIVDDKWMIDKDKPIVVNKNGQAENTIEVKQSDFSVVEALRNDELLAIKRKKEEEITNKEYTNVIPLINKVEGIEKPMQIPPYLDQKIIHEHYEHQTDAHLLPPPPNHVIINHLLTHAIKDDIVMMSVIIRYRHKLVTTVYCKPLN